MANGQLGPVLHHLRGLAGGASLSAASDRELLERFCARRDEAAFGQLLLRHGPMVLHVGRRVLHQAPDAEDVFQATFLLLASKAGTIRKQESVGSWLHGVAHHLALKARARQTRRTAHERRAAQMTKVPPALETAWQELQEVLDQALRGLPEKQRAVLLLCYLQGKTQEEAARLLGCPLGTVRSRLARGRKALQDDLVRRGLALSAAALVTALAANTASTAVPVGLRKATLEAGLRFAAGAEAAGMVSVGAAALAEEGLKTMFATKTRTAAALVLAMSLLTGGVGALAPRTANPAEGPAAQPSVPPATESTNQPRADLYGDPLPPAAVARLGSLRFYHGGRVEHVILSPDGKLVVSVGGAPRLWDADTGRELPLDERFQQATFLAAGGKLLAAVRHENILALWDLGTGKEWQRLPLAAQGPGAVLGLSPDGKTVALQSMRPRDGGGLRASLHFCDVATGTVAEPIDLDGKVVLTFLFSADGKTLLTRTDDNALHVWDVGTRTRRRSSRASPEDFGGAVALSPDGATVATAPTGGQKVRLWDAGTFKELPVLAGQPKTNVNSLAFSPDGKFLAATYPGPTVRLWDVDGRKEARQVRGKDYQVFEVVFSADGKTLAGADGGSVTLWDVETGKFRHDFGHTYCVDALDFSPDGKRLVSGAAYTDNVGRVWDPLTGKEAAQLRGHADGIEVAAYAPDGKLVATGSQDGTARLWDPATGREVRRLAAKDGMIYAMAFAPDGKTIATGGKRKAVHLWDVATGRELRSFDNPGEWILRLAFSPDGKTIATRGIKEAFVRLWDVDRGQEIRQLTGAPAGCPSLQFSPDGQTVAAGDDDGVVRLWDVGTGQVRRPLGAPAGPGARVFSLAFAPDGRSQAAGYEDMTVRLWELASGQERARYTGHRGGAGSVAFSPDGTFLASGGTDRTVIVWDVTGRITGGRPGAADLTPERLDALWADLGGADAVAAPRAAQTLLGAGGQAVGFLKERLRPAAAIDGKRIDRLLADLDSDQFEVREKAARELEELGDGVEPALRKALAGRPSLELRRRAEEVLQALDPSRSPERLRGVRAVEVLELVGTAEGRRVLETVAKGAADARLTREAKASLQRLNDRRATTP
jgi:RNA polymerase sigma factor (sigma-70 family)